MNMSDAISEKYKHLNLLQLGTICETEESTISFCMDIGLLPSVVNCPNCEVTLHKLYSIRNRNKTRYRYQCNKKHCKEIGKNQVPLRKGSVFYNSNLSLAQILFLLYGFTMKLSYQTLKHECRMYEESQLSSKTICHFKQIFHEICVLSVENVICSHKIGGPGKTVQIDEAKFGKRKYGKGRFKEGTWVLGGICNETGDIFLVPVDKRDKETLIPLIQEHVMQGSTIVTDCWKAYHDLSEYHFNHLTVNHTYNFVDPSTGAHTQLIENTWWCIKRDLPSTHSSKSEFYKHLCEFLWRRHYKKLGTNLYLQLLKDVQHYLNTSDGNT